MFRNRRGTPLKLLCYDGQGYWLCQKRLSQGRLKWWPSTPQARVTLSARELQILLWNGNPEAIELFFHPGFEVIHHRTTVFLVVGEGWASVSVCSLQYASCL